MKDDDILVDNRDHFQYMKTVVKAKSDPVWFINNVLEQKLYPKQEEIVREFYRSRYDVSLPQYKRLTLIAGMRPIVGDSLVRTSNGLETIRDVYNRQDNEVILTRYDYNEISDYIKYDSEDTIKLTTRNGYEIEGTGDHPVLVFNGKLEWKNISDVELGDFLCIYRNKYNIKSKHSSDKKLARFLGLLVGDGSYSETAPHRITFTSEDDELKDEFISLCSELFGYIPSVIDDNRTNNTSTLYINSKDIRQELLSYGLDYSTSYTKDIPKYIYKGTESEIVEFLCGLFDTDGYVLNNKSIHLDMTSEKVIYGVQQLLLQFGIISSRKLKHIKYIRKNDKQSYCYTLTLYGENVKLFNKYIGFGLKRKQFEYILKSSSTIDKIPHLHDTLISMKKQIPKSIGDKYTKEWSKIRKQCYGDLRKSTDKPSGITYYILDYIIDYFDKCNVDTSYLKSLRNEHIFFNEVTDISYSKSDVYCVTIPDAGEFIANGIVVKNSGKTALASMLACFELFDTITIDNPAKYYGLLKNQPLFIITIATSSAIADDGVFSNCCNMLEGSEWFNTWGDIRVANDRINCDKKNVYFMVGGSWTNTIVGRTVKCAIFDELDLFEATAGKRGAKNVYTSLSKSTATLGMDGHIIAISSPRSATGLMMSLYEEAKRDPDHSLAYIYPTWEMNPTQSKEMLLKEYGHDMATFHRDFSCQPEIAGELQFPEKIKLDTSINNVLLNPSYVDKHQVVSRVMSIDPASVNDGFGIATAYRSHYGDIIVDGAHLFKKEEGDVYIRPSDIEKFIYPLIPKLNINAFVFDTWMFQNIIEDVEVKFGITADKHIVRKEDYDNWRGLQEHRGDYGVNVVYHPKLEEECNKLVIKQTNIPKTDHPFGGCFVGETRVQLCDGTIPQMKELEDKEFWIFAASPEGRLVPGKGKCRVTKHVDELVDLLLDNGSTVRCTPDHRIMMRDGTYKEAQHIIPHVDRLMPIKITRIGNDGYLQVRDKYGEKLTVHREVVKSIYGNIPPTMIIHHKDFNRINNNPDNLILVSEEEHSRLHALYRHETDTEYSNKTIDALQKYNNSKEGRQLHSDIGKKSLVATAKRGIRRRWIEKRVDFFRADITLASLEYAKEHKCETANSAARLLKCGRNVIIRVLKDNGYSTWDEYLNDTTGYNHRVIDIVHVKLNEPIPVYDIEVDKWNNFVLYNGIVAHNSKDLADAVCNCIWYLTMKEDPKELKKMGPNVAVIRTW